MNEDILKGFRISIGFFIGCVLLFGLVFGIGFHQTSDILEGTFLGDFSFNNSITVSNSISSNQLTTTNLTMNNETLNLSGSNAMIYFSDGSNLSSNSNSGSSSGTLIGYRLFTSSGIYTPNASANSILVEVIGAGGGRGLL